MLQIKKNLEIVMMSALRLFMLKTVINLYVTVCDIERFVQHSTSKFCNKPQISTFGITFIKYVQSQKIGKANNVKNLWYNKTKGHKQGSQNQLRSPMPEGRNPWSYCIIKDLYITITHISNKPCKHQAIDYWADDTLWD